MTTGLAITRTLTHSPVFAVLLYIVVVGGLVVTTGLAVSDIVDHQRGLAQTSDLLDQLRGRGKRSSATPLGAEHPGTPFLEGPTVTVAGATLLQRVAAAIASVGGTIQSSQVDVTGTQAKDGFVSLVVSSEMEQAPWESAMTFPSSSTVCQPKRWSPRRSAPMPLAPS